MTINSAFSNLSDAEQSRIKEEIAPVIEAAAERIHYAEGRRTTFSVIAGVMIAGGVALLTFGLGPIDDEVVKFTSIAAAAAVTGVGGLLFWVYSRQTNRYPFTSATRTWKWFYRDALPNQSAFDIGWKSYLTFKKDSARIKAEYNAQLTPFKEALKPLVHRGVALDQDAEQLYVLHVNEKYKNLQLSHLRNVTSLGLPAVVVVAAIAAGAGWLANKHDTSARNVTYNHNGIAISAKWRVLPHSDQSRFSEVLVEAKITNSTSAPLPPIRWSALDGDSLVIPTEVVPIGPTPRVEPKQATQYSTVLRTAAAAGSNIDTLRPEF